MRSLLCKSLVLGTALIAFAGPSVAQAARTPQELLRNQLLRLHGRLSADALESPEVSEARAAAGRSFAALYQIRENILLEVRKRDEYADLKLALWHYQQALAGMHLEVPVKIKNILAGATDSMSIRGRISKMEVDALEASPEYIAARDEFNALVAAQQRAIADALNRVRDDPQLMALSQQIQSMRRVYGRSTNSGVVAR
jgi:hypothetical protein